MADEEPPKELIKYYACNEYSYDALANNYLWAANPLSFNDPCDCSTKAWEEETFKLDIIKKHFPNFHTEHLPVSYRDQVLEVLLAKLGIICLNGDDKKFEDIIWGYYTNHKGFTISFDRKILSSSLHRTNPVQVNYKRDDEIERFSFTEPDEFKYTVTSWISQKKKIWEPENEWRYIFVDVDPNDLSSRKKYYTRKSVKEITLGLNFFGGNLEFIGNTTQAFAYNHTKEDNLYNYTILKHLADNPKYKISWMVLIDNLNFSKVPVILSYFDPYKIIIKIESGEKAVPSPPSE